MTDDNSKNSPHVFHYFELRVAAKIQIKSRMPTLQFNLELLHSCDFYELSTLHENSWGYYNEKKMLIFQHLSFNIKNLMISQDTIKAATVLLTGGLLRSSFTSKHLSLRRQGKEKEAKKGDKRLLWALSSRMISLHIASRNSSIVPLNSVTFPSILRIRPC